MNNVFIEFNDSQGSLTMSWTFSVLPREGDLVEIGRGRYQVRGPIIWNLGGKATIRAWEI